MIILSYLASDMSAGLIAQTMLIKEDHGAKLGWTLSPFKPYLSKKKFIIVGICQTAFGFGVPIFFLTNVFMNIFCSFHSIIWPISIILFKTLYLTSIREPTTGRYKFRWHEWAIMIIIYLVAVIWIYFAYTSSSLASIYDPTSLYCAQINIQK